MGILAILGKPHKNQGCSLHGAVEHTRCSVSYKINTQIFAEIHRESISKWDKVRLIKAKKQTKEELKTNEMV